MTKYPKIVFLLFGLTLLCSFGLAKEVRAHATPITYKPEASSLLDTIPDTISIHFSERIEQEASGIIVYGPDGARVDSDDSAIDHNNARLYGASVKDSGDGTYTVSWQVVSSDDGHFTKGAFSFSVGKVTKAAGSTQIQIQHITTIPQAATIGIELVGQAIILGALVLFALLWRPFRRRFGIDAIVYEKTAQGRFGYLMIAGVILVVIGAISFIALKTFDLQQLRSGDFYSTLQTFLSTVDGSYALARAIVAIVVLVLFFAFRKAIFASERITKKEILLFVLLFGILFARARVSHAAASHFYPFFSIPVNALHLLFKELWVGGLVVVSTVVAPLFLRAKNVLHFAHLSTAFSQLASVAFGLAGVTGAYIVWLHLKDPSSIFSTQWGARFIILSAFGAILLAVRLYHQFLVEKSALAVCGGTASGREKRMVSWAACTLPLEMAVGVALLFVTSFIIITTPPYVTEKFTFEKSVVSQGAEITISVHPYESSRFLITVNDAQKKTPVSLTDVVVTLTNEEKGIGPIVAKTEERFVGGYALSQDAFAPPGNWKIDIAARRSGAYDAIASFAVDYPRDIEAMRISTEGRSFGKFELLIILAAFGVLIITIALVRFSKKLHLVCINFDLSNSEEPLQAREMGVGMARSWAIALLGLIAISSVFWFAHDRLIKTDFQKQCEKNGHFLFQSVPVRDGQALSSDTVTGCFLDVGLYHFADEREYTFFLQKQEVLVELAASPQTPTAGSPTELDVSLSHIQDGRKVGPAHDIATYHDRILHVIIAGEDLHTFAHIHAEDSGPITDEMRKEARFPFRYIFPQGGHYLINVGYIASGRELSHSLIVNVAGAPKMEKPKLTVQNGSQTEEFDGYRVTFSSPKRIKAGERTKLSYYIEKDGKPIRNVEPYLAAAMHIALVRQDLGLFRHTHGEASQYGSVWFQQLFGKYFKYHIHFAPDNFGPKIITQPWTTIFPSAGIYQVFGEFKHAGRIIVTRFTVEVL